ncbi:MAG: cell division protein FtsL [Lachnospiraceae bacterium]|nr:cell division protein FtsL [Lachnospiraceae bacterium]
MRDYIVEGNTIRALEKEYVQPFKKPVSDAVIRNREKAARMNAGYVAFLVFMASILFVSCIMYINLRSDITESQKNVEQLQSKVAALKLQNDEEYDRIVGNVDMEEIKKVAMNELHMNYPDSGQVSITANNDSDYVRQYREIPSE